MLRKILNLSGVEMLSLDQQKSILGKGKNGQPVGGICADNDWAPVGANPAIYPNYPCAHLDGEVPCLPTLLPDGTILEC
jgi:hypothetical protein